MDGAGGSLIFTSPGLGTSSSIGITNVSESVAGGTTGIVVSSDNGIAATGTSGRFTINGRPVTLTGGDDTNAVLSKLQAAASGSTGTNAFAVNNTAGVVTITGTGGNDVVIAGLTANQLAALGLSNGIIDGTPAGAGGPNPRRGELVDIYNDLLGQIDTLAHDAGFNGVNLLANDDLQVLLNDDGSSTLEIDGLDNSAPGLGLTAIAGSAFNTNSSINASLADVQDALDTLRSQSAKLGSNLSIVEVRQEFTKGHHQRTRDRRRQPDAGGYEPGGRERPCAADAPAARSTALSLASQADQNVLRLF